MATKAQLKPLFESIVGAHGQISNLTADYFKVLEEDLAPFDPADIREALAMHRRRSRFAPTTQELLALLGELGERTARPAEEEAPAGPLSDHELAETAELLEFCYRHQYAGDRRLLHEYIAAMGWLSAQDRKRVRAATDKLISKGGLKAV